MFSSHTTEGEQKGFILITVLFFLLLMGLMVLASLHDTQMALRTSQQYSIALQQFQAAEAGLQKAEAQLAMLSGQDDFHDELSYAGHEVIYDIRRLRLAFCLDQQKAYYYRITAQAKRRQGRPIVLQTTYAKKTTQKCQGHEARLTQEGRSSWRELNK